MIAMIRSKITLPLMGAVIVAPLLHTVSHAQSINSATPQMRTYVSGLGNDANACTATSPCKTFQTALAMTIAGGEIFVLNSANYGAVTINKAVTITSEGAVGGVLATSGAGITINAGSNDIVNLRGLGIDGGNSGTVGIQFVSGRSLTVQKTTIRNFANSGINFAPNGPAVLFVSDTTVANNATNGILVGNGSGAANGALSRVTATGNGVGVFASGSNARLTVADTLASNNNYGIGASASAVMIRNSSVSNNAIGIAADQSAIVRVGQSTITGNSTGWQATNGGQVLSYSNNNVSGNTTDGTSTSTVALQ
jgi:Right handed beta helix region